MPCEATAELLLRDTDALDGRNTPVVDSPGGENAPFLHKRQPAADIVLRQSDHADFGHACRLAGVPPCFKVVLGNVAAGRWPIGGKKCQVGMA